MADDTGETWEVPFPELLRPNAQPVAPRPPATTAPRQVSQTVASTDGAGLSDLQNDTRSKVIAASERYGLNPSTPLAISRVESNYGENIGPSSAGARGPMQIMPGTAVDIARWHNAVSKDKWTPEQILSDRDTNIDAGVYYYSKMLERTGDKAKALFRYNPSNPYVSDVLTQETREQTGQLYPKRSQESTQEWAARTAVEQKRAAMQAGTNGGATTSALEPGGGTVAGAPAPQIPPAAAQPPPFTPPAWAGAAEGEGIPQGERGLEYGGGAARYTPTRENDAAFVQSLIAKPKGGPFEGIGTIPLLIGLIAAGNGQFGPLAAMMEQTRKTQQAATMQPLLTEISRRQGKGDYAGALQLGEIGFGALEGRAPEAAKDLSTTLQSIRKGRNELEGLRTTLNTISDSMSTNHPSYATIQNLKKQADQGSWQSAEAMRDTLKKALDVQITTGPNGTTAVSPLQPDKPMQVHLKQWFTSDDMKGWKGQQLLGEIGKSSIGPVGPDDVINIVNHDANPIMKNGVNINTPANAQLIRTMFNRINADEALMDVSNRTPMSSDTHDMLIAAGVTEDQIRHRADGAIPPEKYQEVFARRQQMAEATGAGAAQAQLEAEKNKPTAFSDKIAVIKNDDGTIMQDMSANQGYADKNHFSVVPKANAYKINQYTLAINQMGDFEKMMKDQDLPSLDETGARVKQYVHGILQRYIPTDAAFTGRQVGQAILGGLLDETLLPEKGQVEPYRQKLQQLYDHPELMTKEQLSTTLGAVRMALQRRKDQLMIQGPDTAGMQPAPAAETIPELKPPPPIAPSREQAKPNQWHRAP